jgi:hypothetical protein
LEVGVHPNCASGLVRPRGFARHYLSPKFMSKNITFTVVGSSCACAIDAKLLLSRRNIIEARFMLVDYVSVSNRTHRRGDPWAIDVSQRQSAGPRHCWW